MSSMPDDTKRLDEEADSDGTHSDASSSESSSSSLLAALPYTKGDTQLPPHPKKIRWSDEAPSSGDDDDACFSPLVVVRLIPGGRLGRHFWRIEDVPEGSSFRTGPETTATAGRRKKKKKKKKRKQRRKKNHRRIENGVGDKGDESPTCATLPPPLPTYVTPDDCVKPISPETSADEGLTETEDEDGAESDASGDSSGSGWGAARTLRELQDGMDEGETDAEEEEEEKADVGNDDGTDMEEEDVDTDAPGQQIEHAIHNIEGFQREKLVEAMMNDVLKNMRAIERRQHAEAEEQQQQQQPRVGRVPGGFSTWEGFSESCNVFRIDLSDSENDDEPSNESTFMDSAGGKGDATDSFIDLLTNKNVDEFVLTQAVEWMDDAQKDDDDDDDDDDEEQCHDDSNHRDSKDCGIGQLGPPKTVTPGDTLVKHSKMRGKSQATACRPTRTPPSSANVVHFQVTQSPPSLPARQISKKKSKKKKKSFAKRMFKMSLQGEIEETKRRTAERKVRTSQSRRKEQGLADADRGMRRVRAGGRGDRGSGYQVQQRPVTPASRQRPSNRPRPAEQKCPPERGFASSGAHRPGQQQGPKDQQRAVYAHEAFRKSGGRGRDRVGASQNNAERGRAPAQRSKMPQPYSASAANSRPRQQRDMPAPDSTAKSCAQHSAIGEDKKKKKKLFPKLNLKAERVNT